MTEPMTCQSCGAALPDNAAFCTSCGAKVEATADPEQAASQITGSVGEDATQVVTPGLHDDTQVLPEAAPVEAPVADPAAWSAPEAAPPAPPPPWQPPPGAAEPPAAWQPPPVPAQDWAQPGPAGDRAWEPSPAPAAPPSQWQQPPPTAWPAGPGVATAARPAPAQRAGSPLGAIIAFLGAILIIVGVFTQWANLKNGGSSNKFTGWEMVTEKNAILFGPFRSPDPAILLGIAAASIAVGGLMIAGVAKTVMRVLLALAGVGAAVVAVRDYLSIKDTVKKFDESFTLTFQYGFWIVVAGALVLIIAAIVPSGRDS